MRKEKERKKERKKREASIIVMLSKIDAKQFDSFFVFAPFEK